MFYFLATFAPGACPVPDEGWAASGEPFRLSRSLDEAVAATQVPGAAPGAGRVLVLDARALAAAGGLHGTNDLSPTASVVSRAAVVNVDPDGDLWPPVAVVAAGGAVLQAGDGGAPDVLMIFRRGCWDLPKGKLDDGETIPECALREVSEEVGVPLASLAITADLGPTVHGYPLPRKGAYAVKTTHWYAMTTTAEAFEAQDDEGIEAVAWVAVVEAAARVGYDSLRDLLQGLADGATAEGAPGATG